MQARRLCNHGVQVLSHAMATATQCLPKSPSAPAGHEHT
jgi:hypothetical protein